MVIIYIRRWKRFFNTLLFGAREVVQESLGFCPFELVFSHDVCGPLKLLKGNLLNDSTQMNLLNFVSTYKDRLRKACHYAKQKLESTQESMKSWYDPQGEILDLFMNYRGLKTS